MRKWIDRYKGFFRNLKIVYVINNWLHARKLTHHRPLYRQYGLRKSIFRSISSQDFAHLPQPKPWLDQSDALTQLEAHPEFADFDAAQQAQLRRWIEEGVMVWKDFLDPKQVVEVNAEVDRLLANKRVGFHYSGRIMFAYRQSTMLQALVAHPDLMRLMNFALGRPMEAFQSINFLKGSQQRAHSDSIHMSTYPPGYLAATWLALEPIDSGNGPVLYYPGSHRLPYMRNQDFDHGGHAWRIGPTANQRYEHAIEQLIQQHQWEAVPFHAEAGDLLLWHANLIHAGSPIQDTQRTRRSMVVHYFARDVICYHELTQRPALKPLQEVV